MYRTSTATPGDVVTTDAIVRRHIACARCASRFDLPPYHTMHDEVRHRSRLQDWLRQHRDHTEALGFGMAVAAD